MGSSVKQQDKKVLTDIGSVIIIYVVVHYLQFGVL